MELMNRIENLDLAHVADRLVNEAGFEEDIAMTATEMYKKFLYLRKVYVGESLVPPRLVDEAWHEHILFTRNYTAICEDLYGSYMHHTPQPIRPTLEQMRGHSAGWERTKELFQQEFGIDLENSRVDGMRVAANSN
ncbi:MAG: hypothetical protein OXR68_05530 [Alphaproteobacteria bacterium]|nr:hypothetical protein [Alphaproteobacteria bacterium]